MSRSLVPDRHRWSMLSTSGRTASHLNYLDVRPCSACIAGLEPFGAPLDWSINSGLIKLTLYVQNVRCDLIHSMLSASKNCDKSAHPTLHRHFLPPMYMKSFFERSKNTINHILEVFISSLGQPSN
jgi:hypothetical protein